MITFTMMNEDAKGFGYDDETGEIVTYSINEETGEPFLICQPPLPNPSIKPQIFSPGACPIEFPSGYVSRSRKFQSLKENIIAGSNKLSHRLVLIPTIFFCIPLITAFLMLFEIFLHECCHEKNKLIKDSSMYYRSPFHLVTKIFCGLCRETEAASKIRQLQDKRHKKYFGVRSSEFAFMRNIPAF